jgi:adenylate kinase family enzyme
MQAVCRQLNEIYQIRSPDLAISLHCPEDIARQRYLSRKLPGRLLDDQTLFEKRFQEFERENPRIVQHFHAAGNLIEVR